MKFDEKAIDALLNPASPVTPEGRREFFDILRDALPLIRQVDSLPGEAACLEELKRRLGPHCLGYEPRLRQILYEICNHRPEYRGEFIEAARVKVAPPAARVRQLTRKQAELRAAFEQLTPREKAILRAVEALHTLDGNCNTALADVWPPVVQGADVDVLRDDPALAPLVRACDAAQLVEETNG